MNLSVPGTVFSFGNSRLGGKFSTHVRDGRPCVVITLDRGGSRPYVGHRGPKSAARLLYRLARRLR